MEEFYMLTKEIQINRKYDCIEIGKCDEEKLYIVRITEMNMNNDVDSIEYQLMLQKDVDNINGFEDYNKSSSFNDFGIMRKEFIEDYADSTDDMVSFERLRDAWEVTIDEAFNDILNGTTTKDDYVLVEINYNVFTFFPFSLDWICGGWFPHYMTFELPIAKYNVDVLIKEIERGDMKDVCIIHDANYANYICGHFDDVKTLTFAIKIDNIKNVAYEGGRSVNHISPFIPFINAYKK